ncbi:MAG: tellurite resistance TerB C-terminal domain-containing protein, partial [Tumebacillaceae bacterium]
YIKEPEKAVERLIRFYNDFHDIQPRLDVTVVRWIGDLYLKMGDLEHALYWYTHGQYGDLFEKLSWYRFGQMDIPLPLLKKVAGWLKTQFYRDKLPEIDRTMEEMMGQVFRSFYAIEGEHPLDRFARYDDDPVVYLFSSTPIHEKYYLDGFRRYESSGAFVHFVKNCMRYGENVLRLHEGKSRLKCDESVGLYFREVEAQYPPYVAPEKEKKPRKTVEQEPVQEVPLMARELPEEPIELDLERVRSLNSETDWLVEMMQEEIQGGDLLLSPPKRGENMLRDTGMGQPAGGDGLGLSDTDEPAPHDGNLLGSLFAASEAGEMDELLDELGAGEQAFLLHLVHTGERDRKGLAQWLKGKRMFLDATVLAINERAVDGGFDPLLEEEDDEVRVYEEYETAVEAWAANKEEMSE